MTITTKLGSGNLFVRFASSGLIALFAVVIFIKTTNILGFYSEIVLGLSIFSINLFAILGYTHVVLKNPQILTESDSPDLAYYLGFCLTVGALSVTFITDTLISQYALIEGKDSAQLQSNLIKGSLIQFGVGLTATLIGLCAKIYLASKQSNDSLEPEELYRNFRVEINSFEKEMRLITDSYSKTIEDSVLKIKNSVTETCNVFDQLHEVTSNSNKLIAKNISHDNISKPINEFIESISEITKVTKEFTSAGKESIEGFKNVSISIGAMKSIIETANTSIQSLQSSTIELSNSSKNLIDSNGSIKTINQNLATDLSSFSSTIKTANQNSTDFSTSLKLISEKVTQTSQELSDLRGKNINFVQVLSDFSEKVTNLTNSLSQFGNQLSTLQNQLLKNNSDLKLNNESTQLFINDVQSFQNAVKKITSELSQLENKLNQINKASY
jgi:hypothetical protein